VDFPETKATAELLENPDLRERMGTQGLLEE